MEQPQDIVALIDAGLAQNKVAMDLLRCDEDVIWGALKESVDKGYRSEAEAEQEFIDWRENMRALGYIAAKS